MTKIDIDLKGVSKTLLLPLVGRIKSTQLPYSPIKDKHSLRLAEMINYDFDALQDRLGNDSFIWWMARAYHFDNAIRQFLQFHPNATIVNLGAGLETAFYRVDNGTLNWVDLDIPETIALREKLIPAPPRVRYLAKSIFDYSWMDDVKALGSADVFFFAGGFFMYFTPEQIKALFIHMANYFPHAELIFDNTSPKSLIYSNKMMSRAGIPDTVLQWGVQNAREIESWAPNIKVCQQTGYFKGLTNLTGSPWFLRLRMRYYDFVHRSGIIHLQFV